MVILCIMENYIKLLLELILIQHWLKYIQLLVLLIKIKQINMVKLKRL